MSFRHLHVRHVVALTALFAAGSAWGQAPQATPADATPATVSAETTPAEAPAPAAAPAPAVAEAATGPVAPGDAKAGEAKAAVCGACHGPDGNPSDKQYPKLAGQNEAYTARQLELFKTQKRQNPIMLGFASTLSAQDMRDIGAFFATKTALPGVADDALIERGQALYRGGDAQLGVPACMACHGPDGRGMAGSGFPQLAGQWTDYTTAKLKEWKDGTTWGSDTNATIMPTIAHALSEADINAVSSYIEGLHTAGADSAAAAAK